MISAQAHDCTRSVAPIPGLPRRRPTEQPLVPPAWLEHPARGQEVGHIEREGLAVVLDRYLLRLSRHDCVCRLRLGRLATHLLDSRSYHRLGFARLSDYTIERLGLSGRELQSLARVWRAVKGLPRLGPRPFAQENSAGPSCACCASLPAQRLSRLGSRVLKR